MVFQWLLKCVKAQNNLTEHVEAAKCLTSFKIFFYDFSKTSEVPEGQKQSFRTCKSCKMFYKP